MSKSTTTVSSSNQLYTEYDYAKIFIGDNYFNRETFFEATSAEVTLLAGTVLGRITSGGNAGKVVPLASGASNGSQFPIGILAETVTVAADADKEVRVCYKGDVAEPLLVLDGSDTLDTVISDRTIGDRLRDLGINFRPSTELTESDNS